MNTMNKTVNLPTYTIEDIQQLGPCYDPAEVLPEDWTGTPLDLLKCPDLRHPEKDSIWAVTKWLDRSSQGRFALRVARDVEDLADDDRVPRCNDATERYLAGQASKDDLFTAWEAAEAAAEAAAGEAAAAAYAAADAAADAGEAADAWAVWATAREAAFAAAGEDADAAGEAWTRYHRWLIEGIESGQLTFEKEM